MMQSHTKDHFPDVVDAEALVKNVFAAVDRKDATAFANFLAEDGTFRFGNADSVHGRNHVEEAVAGFFKLLEGLSHDNIEFWQVGNVITVRLDVTYWRTDGHEVLMPAMTLWRLKGDKIADYQIFSDLTPLFS